jgi:hypothetical protein
LEFAMLLRTIAVASVALLFATPGDAATFYVAGYGSGMTCTVSAPCPGLAQAVFLADVGDTVVCVSPPGAQGVVLTKSITIDCSSARAPVREVGVGSPVSGVIINIAVSTADPLRTVRLRGLDVDGARFFDRGIDIQAATVVYIEDCVVSNAKQQGILDRRTGGQTKLFIKDSIFSGNGGAGIVAAAGAIGIVVLYNVSSEHNAYGIAVASGNNIAISHSVFSGNSVVGVQGDTGAQIMLDGSTISHNNIGVQSSAAVRLSNNNIAFNNIAISGATGTFGNNRLSGNNSAGTVSTPNGSGSGEFAQQ